MSACFLFPVATTIVFQLCLLVSLTSRVTGQPPVFPCLIPASHSEYQEYISDESHRPGHGKYLNRSLIPQQIDWRNHNGKRYTTWTRNQLVPSFCASCWAMASTSALADRIMIEHGDHLPEWDLSAQLLLDCSAAPPNFGCHGGNPGVAYEFMRVHGVTHDSCAPYTATGIDTGNRCTPTSFCKECSYYNQCAAQKSYSLWKVSSHGIISGELSMLQALQYGPIVCGMAITPAFEALSSFAVYNDKSIDKKQQLAVSIVGYGASSGADNVHYWIGRNTWGTIWGQNGYFRIIRGRNNLGIESECYWAIPEPYAIPVNASNPNSSHAGIVGANSNHNNIQDRIFHKGTATETVTRGTKDNENDSDRGEDGVRTPVSVSVSVPVSVALPEYFSWGNVNGINFLSGIRNQNLPQYCKSDWAHASTSTLSDRLTILRYLSYPHGSALWPEINLSPQVLINAKVGNCGGGTTANVMKYLHANYISDETCQSYSANNDPNGPVPALNVCKSCVPGNVSEPIASQYCYPVKNFTQYSISGYAQITGVNKMKNEIYSRGPIVCEVEQTAQWLAYTHGIFSQVIFYPTTNHQVSVFGWGSANGTAYWMGRNSLGQYWGELGYFRILMGSNNLGIETDCTWALPQQRPTVNQTTKTVDTN